MSLRNISRIHFKHYIWVLGTFFSFAILFLLSGFYKNALFIGMMLSVCMFAFLIICKVKPVTCLFYSTFTGFLVMAVDNVMSSFLIFFCGRTHLSGINNYIEFFTVWAIGYVVAFFLSAVVGKQIEKILGEFSSFCNNSQLDSMFLLLSIISFSLLVYFYVHTFLLTNQDNSMSMTAVNSLLILLMLILLISIGFTVHKIIIQQIELNHNKELMQNFKSYNTSIENLYDDIKSVGHDYVNILTASQGYIANNDFEGWKEYFSVNVMPVFKTAFDYDILTNLVNGIKIPSLKGLLLIKLLSAYEKNIDMQIGVDDNIQDNFKNILDLNRLIGIFLDNAIEECGKKEGMKIQFAMYKTNNHVTVLVINDIYGEPPALGKIFEKNVSSKGDGRGAGLFNAQRLIAKNNAMCLHTSIRGNEMYQKLTVGLR
jgi:two-component system sensor histidine kinase AgrC